MNRGGARPGVESGFGGDGEGRGTGGWAGLVGRGLVRLLEVVVAGLMGVLVLDVLWQVVSRYVLRDPSSWTDELATLLMVWVALLGSSVAFIRRSHLGVDYFVGKFPVKWRQPVEVLGYLVIGFFAVAVLILGGVRWVALTLLTGQVSPALGVKMGYVYLALPLSGAIILAFSVGAVWGCCRARGGKEGGLP